MPVSGRNIQLGRSSKRDGLWNLTSTARLVAAKRGGLGDTVTTALFVTAGTTLQFNVGDVGTNGAGAAGTPGSSFSSEGNPGGGASDVRHAPFTLLDRAIVAGGGGGGTGGARGGYGGYPYGGPGESLSTAGLSGLGGDQTHGGYGTFDGGFTGGFGFGGPGASGTGSFIPFGAGSGGGSGYYGGGGGANSGPDYFGGAGGGGSSFGPQGSIFNNQAPGPGLIRITYFTNPDPTEIVFSAQGTHLAGTSPTVSALLRTVAGRKPVPDHTIKFSADGKACFGLTDATGRASCALGPLPAGTFTVVAGFAGWFPTYGPSSATASITMVADTTPPVISGVPANITVDAMGPAGTNVTYTTPTAVDDWSGVVPVTCDPPSGSTFPVGTTTVTCTAADSSGNVATETFTVTVRRIATQVSVTPVVASLAQIQATLTARTSPIAGQTIKFTAGGKLLCTAVTDGNGVASCPSRLFRVLVPVVLALGYQASFVGNDIYLPSSGRSTIL